MWWRVGVLMVLLQLVVIIVGQHLAPIIQPVIQSLFGG
jgi:hypothetical protein